MCSAQRVIGSIEFHVHRTSSGPRVRQARIFIDGHGFHVVDWPRRRVRVERRLTGGYLLRVERAQSSYSAAVVVEATDHTIFEGILEHVTGIHVPSRATFTITL